LPVSFYVTCELELRFAQPVTVTSHWLWRRRLFRGMSNVPANTVTTNGQHDAFLTTYNFAFL